MRSSNGQQADAQLEAQMVLDGDLKIDEVSEEAKALVKLAYAQASALRVLLLQQAYAERDAARLAFDLSSESYTIHTGAVKTIENGIRIRYNEITRKIGESALEIRKSYNQWYNSFDKDSWLSAVGAKRGDDLAERSWRRLVLYDRPTKPHPLFDNPTTADQLYANKIDAMYSMQYQSVMNEALKAKMINKREYTASNVWLHEAERHFGAGWNLNEEAGTAARRMIVGEQLYALAVFGELLKDIGNSMF